MPLLVAATDRYSQVRNMAMPTALITDNNVTLLQRLTHQDLRNTDRNRLTSLSWAAVDGSLEVFEWLLLHYGHVDQEVSRVRLSPAHKDTVRCREVHVH